MDLQLLLDDFSAGLKNRSGLLTEDSVRYYLFACMLKQDPQLNNYLLELPYEDMVNQNGNSIDHAVLPVFVQTENIGEKMQLDLCYYNGIECYSIEIKFHRHPDKDTAFPHTMAAGALFNDIRRLKLIRSSAKIYKRLFLYVTDSEMHRYLCDNMGKGGFRTELSAFYNLKPSISSMFQFLEKSSNGCDSAPTTFMENAKKSAKNHADSNVTCTLKKEYDSDLICNSRSMQESQCHVRLYTVLDDDPQR